MKKISAILLAAGESKRTGRENKLLFTYKEKTLIRHVTEELLAAQISECIVVTGQPSKLINLALANLPIKVIENKGFATGMSSSIQEGVKHLRKDIDAFMICLSDMPLLNGMFYNALIKKFNAISQNDLSFILRPAYKEKPGHPVIFARKYADEILSYKNPQGCLELINSHLEYLVEYPLANEAYYTDIDTIEDYYRLRE